MGPRPLACPVLCYPPPPPPFPSRIVRLISAGVCRPFFVSQFDCMGREHVHLLPPRLVINMCRKYVCRVVLPDPATALARDKASCRDRDNASPRTHSLALRGLSPGKHLLQLELRIPFRAAWGVLGCAHALEEVGSLCLKSQVVGVGGTGAFYWLLGLGGRAERCFVSLSG